MTNRYVQRIAELERQLTYFHQRQQELAAKLVQNDATTSALRHELEQKRRGFALLARVSASLDSAGNTSILSTVSQQLNPALNMQRTAVLMRTADGHYRANLLQGYGRADSERIRACELTLPEAVLNTTAPIVLTKAADPNVLGELRETLALPYVIVMPIIVDDTAEAVLVTGRLRERHPFMPRLGDGDAETVRALSAFIAAVISQQRVAEIEHMATHDPLTGLPNVRLGNERLKQAITSAGRLGTTLALLYIDLDGFKAINDNHGHSAGDASLREVAQRLRRCVRETDTVARVGGDEFIVILPGVRQPEDAREVADNILAALAPPIDWRQRHSHIGASIGIALFPDDGVTPDELIGAADQAMYAVKRDNKNTYRHASGSHN